MRISFVIPVLLIASLALVSCSKDSARPQPGNENPDEALHPGGPYFVGMIQTGTADTNFVFTYNDKNQVTKVVNTTLKDSLVATYNSAGYPSKVVVAPNGDPVTVEYNYNADNQLIRVTSTWEDDTRPPFKATYKDTLEYSNGVLVKRSSYSIIPGINNGEPYYAGGYTYEVTNGNITSVKAFDMDGHLMSTTTLTYNSDPNVFKTLSLLNVFGVVSIDDIANEDTWFNNNLLTGVSIVTSAEAHIKNFYEYSYNDKKQLIKVVAGPTADSEGSAWGSHTRVFSY